MSRENQTPATANKPLHHGGKIEHFFRRTLYIIERIIAVITICVLLVTLGLELWRMFTTAGYLDDMHTCLHNILTIVVGLEFVRMIIDTTPATILEVLTVAITRQVILSHDDYISIAVGVACVAGLFAIRRFLVKRSEMKEELVETE